MMPATAPVARRRPTLRPCVKCGIGPRYIDTDGESTFLCVECLVSGTYRADKAKAEELFYETRDRRHFLVTDCGWVGGW